MNTSSIDFQVSSQSGHSARVDMSLLLNGCVLPVTQLGPDFILINTPVNHAPATATLVMKVDEHERQWNVFLPLGMSATSKRVQIAPVTRLLKQFRSHTNGAYRLFST